MDKYLSKARSHLTQFKTYEICQIPRLENSNVDALAKLAFAYEADLARSIPVEILDSPSILEPDVMKIDSQPPSWMDPIREYLMDRLSEDSLEAKKLRRTAARFFLRDGQLYRCRYSLPLLKCLTPEEGNYVIREIHEVVSDNH